MPPEKPITDPDHLLPPAPHKPVGPLVAIVVILALLIIGAMYFFRARVQTSPQTQLPYIPAATTTLPTATSTD